MIKVKILNKSQNPNPVFNHYGDSGCDIRSDVDVILQPGETKKVSTGLYFEVPLGWEIQVRPRSGLALNSQISVLNSPGTVDSNYRGELCVILHNFGKTEYSVKTGDRIAQIVFCPVAVDIEFTQVLTHANLSDTTRAQEGFGSTGKS